MLSYTSVSHTFTIICLHVYHQSVPCIDDLLKILLRSSQEKHQEENNTHIKDTDRNQMISSNDDNTMVSVTCLGHSRPELTDQTSYCASNTYSLEPLQLLLVLMVLHYCMRQLHQQMHINYTLLNTLTQISESKILQFSPSVIMLTVLSTDNTEQRLQLI